MTFRIGFPFKESQSHHRTTYVIFQFDKVVKIWKLFLRLFHCNFCVWQLWKKPPKSRQYTKKFHPPISVIFLAIAICQNCFLLIPISSPWLFDSWTTLYEIMNSGDSIWGAFFCGSVYQAMCFCRDGSICPPNFSQRFPPFSGLDLPLQLFSPFLRCLDGNLWAIAPIT